MSHIRTVQIGSHSFAQGPVAYTCPGIDRMGVWADWPPQDRITEGKEVPSVRKAETE